ncbi:YggS family pyridoxal phosphate-dependent enzyme [Halocola ammonii]
MTDIKSNLEKIKAQLPDHVKLVAVSKTKPNEDIQAAYETGQRIFGENKAQEMQGKAEELPKDIEWHMIGHLQRNKVKYIAPFVSLIHSIDSWRLLKEVNKRAKNEDRVIDCLLQIHIAKEESKFGLDEDELADILYSEEFENLENIRIVGLMGMATLTENEEQIRREFKSLKDLFDKLKKDKFALEDSFKELSMGMSSDFKIAIEEGSTMVRIGSDIFGARNYG